ncbi:MAG: DedA family protein [Desulfobacteraceae bacterium]|nr:DedA family protein [Desulfobacteraceae bacterium]
METLIQIGLPGLFLASFLAATVLPMSSEVLLGLLLANGSDPLLTMAVATSGNVLGSVVNYGLGLWGSTFLVKKVIRISEKEFAGAADRLNRFGAVSLLFAWVPVIGDPLTFAAGVMRINFILFLVLVTAGKALRYLAITLALA